MVMTGRNYRIFLQSDGTIAYALRIDSYCGCGVLVSDAESCWNCLDIPRVTD